MKKPQQYLLIVLGTFSVGMGLLGIFLPVLPTTPFLLLAAYCYARSSERLLNWLLTNRWFGAYIRNYRDGRGLPLREKIVTIAALWLTIGLSAAFAVSQFWLRALLALIAAGVTVHLIRINTYRPEPKHSLGERLPEPDTTPPDPL